MGGPTNNPPAGWYDDGKGGQRYWDGANWTERTAASPSSTSTVSPTSPEGIALDQTSPNKPHVVAIVALSVAVVGFIFACMPGALIAGWVLLPIAFVLSIVAFFLRGKKWPAIAALTISIVGTIVGFVVFFAVVSDSFDDAFNGGDITVSQPGEDDAVDDEPSAEAGPEAGTRENPLPLGTVISGEEWQVVVNSVTLDATDAVLAANMFNEPPAAGAVYALANVTVTYLGPDSGFASTVGLDYVTATGEVISTWDNFAVAPEPTLDSGELYTGGSSTGNIVFQIPASGDGSIRVRPGFLGDEVFVAVR